MMKAIQSPLALNKLLDVASRGKGICHAVSLRWVSLLCRRSNPHFGLLTRQAIDVFADLTVITYF
jgi:hypothetical protein